MQILRQVRVHTVGELVAILQQLPQALPVESFGADCGGYDVCSGFNTNVIHATDDDGNNARVSIEHEDSWDFSS